MALSLVYVLTCFAFYCLIRPGFSTIRYGNPAYNTNEATIKQLPLEFNNTVHETVNRTVEYLYGLSYNETHNQTTAVRVSVSVLTDKLRYDSPLLVVVRQPQHIISWQVPLTDSTYNYSVKYYSVSRTICPLEQKYRVEKLGPQEIHIDISTASLMPLNFQLTASLVTTFELKLNDWSHIVVSPSEPQYYQYTFTSPDEVVLVKVQSPDTFCMTVSVQDATCPVYDLVQNIKFGDVYQTVRGRGAIRAAAEDFESGKFFMVLVVHTSDEECGGNEMDMFLIQPAEQLERKKHVDIHAEPSLTKKEYVTGILAIVIWFTVFYFVALFISCIYHLNTRDDSMTEPIVEDPSQGSQPRQHSDNDSTYGAMSTASSTSGYGNGMPHRIAPPGGSDNDSVDETEIDTLHDADDEKDVYRSKPMLYVADLAKKSHRRLNKKYKLYSWNLLLIVIFYGLPVIQLVITYQKVLNSTGNDDMCFYNFYCANSLGVLYSFNNVFSNVGYMMLGILFIILVYRRDILHKRRMKANGSREKHYGIPQQYGLCYALGIALFMEGILSGCYHVCPSYSNFQFDTSFMYMIGWLLMLKIYQQRHPDISPAAYVAYNLLACLIFIVVIGVTSGTPFEFWAVYAVLHVIITLFLSLQIYYMGRWRLDRGLYQRCCLYLHSDILKCSKPLYPDRMILLVICCIINWAIMIYGIITRPVDFASFLVSIVILNLLMYFAFYIIMKVRYGERLLPPAIIYSVLATVCWFVAFYFFVAKLTSWRGSAAKSREGNRDCILFKFYDDHDVWHVLSSMSLFFSFMTILVLDDDLVNTRRDRIPVF